MTKPAGSCAGPSGRARSWWPRPGHSREPLTVKPAAGGRSAAAILSHVAGAEWAYVSATLGTLRGGSAAIAAIESAGDAAVGGPGRRADGPDGARSSAMTPDELARVVERDGKPRWTARRMLRRLLEHESEHTRSCVATPS